MQIHHILFFHSSVGECLCCFYPLASVNSAVINIRVHTFIWMSYLQFFWGMPKGRIAGLRGNFGFSLLRNCHTISHSGCTIGILPSNVCVFLVFCSFSNTCYFLILLIMVHLLDVTWYLIVALVCISLRTQGSSFHENRGFLHQTKVIQIWGLRRHLSFVWSLISNVELLQVGLPRKKIKVILPSVSGFLGSVDGRLHLKCPE